MAEYLTKMTIDEDRIHVLTKYASRKGIKKLVKSDHNILTCHFNLKWKTINNNIRQEMFNLKNRENQQKFFLLTNETDGYTKCFKNSDEDIDVQLRKWNKKLQSEAAGKYYTYFIIFL